MKEPSQTKVCYIGELHLPLDFITGVAFAVYFRAKDNELRHYLYFVRGLLSDLPENTYIGFSER